MSRNLPDRIRLEIDPRHTVVWWGRRSGLEVVKEISEAVYSSLVVMCLAVWGDEIITSAFGLERAKLYWVGIGIAVLWVAKAGIIEVIEWRNEVYVVTQNTGDKGGKIYKFYGWISYKKISDVITQSSPVAATTFPAGNRIWKFFTGQKVINFSLKSANHAFMDGSNVSNQIEWAIMMVQGSRPKENGKEGFDGVDDLIKLRMMGGINDTEFKDASRTLVHKKLYG